MENINYYLIIVLTLELIILILMLALILGRRIWSRFHQKKVAKEKQAISQTVINYMNNQEALNSKKVFNGFSKDLVLNQMEAFERRFKGEQWDQLKFEISKAELLPRARKWTKSRHWLNRNFAARCFALSPSESDEKSILSLLDDPEFLVHSMAAVAAVKLEVKEGIFKIVRLMSKVGGYARIFYRDILLQSNSSKVFSWVEEIAAEKDLLTQLACLDLLSGITKVITSPVLKEALQSENQAVRFAALKVYAHNPQMDSAEVLLKYMDDPDEEIRAAAASGLEYFATAATIEKLSKALTDPSWIVRVQAANSLKNMGKMGLQVLQQQNPQMNKNAFEAASYALEFDG